ncbi:MAG: peptide ABC transporter substrate-binding protein [Undibacterium sp.]|nr:peptide ABC transporter substrate-binding protein [Opitutaceae bacterium]
MSVRPFVTVLVSAVLLGFSACSKRETAVEIGNRTGTLHVNNAAEPRDLDPHTTTIPADINIIRAVMEGLCELDSVDCHPIPGVASQWSVSPDGLTWTFELRADAKWSNGDPVTARDFIYAYHRMLSPGLGGEYREQFYILKNARAFATGKLPDFAAVGVQAPGDHTLVLSLHQPVPYLPTLATQICWFPLHRATIEKFGRMEARGTAWTRPGNHVGNGAFNLAEWLPDQHLRVTKSPTYWDHAKVALNAVVFYPIDNPSVGEAAFRAGQLHIAVPPLAKVLAAQKDPALKSILQAGVALSTAILRLNCERAPFTDARVRRALSLAIDRPQIAQRIIHSDSAATSFTPPNCAGYTADPTVTTDVAEARRLLAVAGFPEGRGFPKTEVVFYVYHGTEQVVAEALQQMWRTQLGIDVALVQQEMKTVISARRTRDYGMLAGFWTGDYLDPATFLDIFLTNGGNNQTGWTNAEYDRLVAESQRTLDQTARYALLRRAESILLTEAPVIPLYHVPMRRFVTPSVKGWHENLLDLHSLKAVSLTQ